MSVKVSKNILDTAAFFKALLLQHLITVLPYFMHIRNKLLVFLMFKSIKHF